MVSADFSLKGSLSYTACYKLTETGDCFWKNSTAFLIVAITINEKITSSQFAQKGLRSLNILR